MIEDLTKTQLVLLTLLVSFVTSIATGIITFSLLQEAPPIVTQTINRVVEQTIQQVAPDAGSDKEPQKVTTVVVKEGDEIISSIGKNTGSIVRITSNDPTPEADNFFAMGVVLSKGGLIIAPTRDSFNPQFVYTATFPDQSTHSLAYLGQDQKSTVNFFKVVHDVGTQPFASGAPAKFSSEEPKLGQTVILLEGKTKNVVTIGHVSNLTYEDASQKVANGFETDFSPKGEVLGAPLLNLSGEIVGFRKGPSTALSATSFVSSAYLKADIAEYLKK